MNHSKALEPAYENLCIKL